MQSDVRLMNRSYRTFLSCMFTQEICFFKISNVIFETSISVIDFNLQYHRGKYCIIKKNHY